MSGKSKLPEDNRYALQPDRTYAIPGGPAAKNLGAINVNKLAERVRGGDGDSGYGQQRSSQ